jgi:hypothetical protein
VHFIDDVDFIATVGGHVLEIFPQLPDLIDAVVGGAVDLVDIRRAPGRDVLAGPALVARLRFRPRLAIQGFGHDPGNRGLAGAAGSGEQQGMRHPTRRQRVAERARDVPLLKNLGKGLRSVFPG